MKKELNLMKKNDFGEIFEWSFKLYASNFFYLMKILAVFIIPVSLLFIIIGYLSYSKTQELMSMLQNNFENFQFGTLITWIILICISFLIYAISVVFIGSASIRAIGYKLENKDIPAKIVLKETFSKTLPMIITSLIVNVMIMFSFIFCICLFIPTIILVIFSSFVFQAVMLENKYYFSSIKRSFILASKDFWMILVLIVVFYVLYYFVSMVINIPLYIVPYIGFFKEMMKNQGATDPTFMVNFYKDFSFFYILILILNTILWMFFIPLFTIALTLKFYNLRNIYEGSDLLDKIDKSLNSSKSDTTNE